MARYLTPAKIGLLVLIELYTGGAVPNEAILPVLSFVASHVLDLESSGSSVDHHSQWRKADQAINLLESINDFEQLLLPYPAAVGLPGRRLWHIFLAKMWGIDSFDALHQFFDKQPQLLAMPKEALRRMAEAGIPPPAGAGGMSLSRNSPFGSFVRKSHVEFSRLRFSDVSDLWQGLVKYRQPTSAAWKRRNPAFGSLSFDSVILAGESEWGQGTVAIAAIAYPDFMGPEKESSGALAPSTDDLESLLEFQISQMQKIGERVPVEIQKRFSSLLGSSRSAPSISHYLSFLEAWRSGDYPTSFDYLHRYFDYTMHNRDRLFYHYALLNLAVLQADFGCHKDAVAAILETITTARENRDMTCLNFALNWLFNFGRQYPHFVSDLESNSMLGTGRETLAFLRIKAKETGMWSTWSSALLNEAKMGLSTGDSVATALEYMVRSSQLLVERNMTNMFGCQIQMQIALWDRLGATVLSTMMCEVFLRCHAHNANLDDALKITSRLACLLASKGKFDEAMSLLEGMDQNALRTSRANKYWRRYRGLIKLRRDMHQNDLEDAECLLSQLLQSQPDDLEPDLVFVIDAMHVEALTRRGNFQEAFAKVERKMAEARDQEGDIAVRVRLLLMKASLFDKAGRPQRGFTTAMRAAIIAWRTRLMTLLWQAIGAIANIIISLDEFDAAVQLLVVVIPRCLEVEGAFLVANLYSSLADANMGIAGKMDPKSKKRTEYITKASEAIRQAFDQYSRVGDVEKQCEMMAKQATIMKVVGDNNLANDCTAKYMELRKATAKIR